MAFGNTPVTTGTPVGTPLGEVAVPNHAGGDLTALRGASPSTDGNGNETAAVAAVIENVNANGQATMAGSAPVVLPSDQFRLGTGDGAGTAGTPEYELGLYSSGGPVDSTGKSQLLTVDRLRSYQGKSPAGSSANITSTLANDANLVFGAAPKTIMPGQAIQLSVGAGSAVETVYVTTSYVPSSTATSIPLQTPVVNAGSTTAKWDIFTPLGPGGSALLPTGLMAPVPLALIDTNTTNQFWLAGNADTDGISNNRPLAVNAVTYNGATDDRARGNLDVTLLASAARTTTQTSADITNYNGRGIKVWLDMTVVGTGSVTLTINGKDPASGKYILLLSGVAVVTNITSVYTIYPGAPATNNVSANDILPRTFQIVVTANNANSATYSVGYSLIL